MRFSIARRIWHLRFFFLCMISCCQFELALSQFSSSAIILNKADKVEFCKDIFVLGMKLLDLWELMPANNPELLPRQASLRPHSHSKQDNFVHNKKYVCKQSVLEGTLDHCFAGLQSEQKCHPSWPKMRLSSTTTTLLTSSRLVASNTTRPWPRS